MDEFCEEKGFVGWFETSAKENTNIDDASRLLVSKILENALKLQETNFDNQEAEEKIILRKTSIGIMAKDMVTKGGCCG